MPYIITTSTPYHDEERGADTIETRTAVATLDDARIAVAKVYDDIEYSNVEAAMDNCWEAENLSIEGKTIGPLPNGTVIEVRHVDWIAMRAMAGRLPVRTHDKPAVIAAFNER